MANIEELIRNKREFFDEEEPREGHFKRFRKKLENGKKINVQFVVRVAAMIVAGIVLAAITNYLSGGNKNQDVLSKLDHEVKEAIFYYNSLSKDMIEEIKSLPIENEEVKDELLNDIKNYEKNYEKIVDDMSKYPENDEMIRALIEYHRNKTEFLSHIIEQFHTVYEERII